MKRVIYLTIAVIICAALALTACAPKQTSVIGFEHWPGGPKHGVADAGL